MATSFFGVPVVSRDIALPMLQFSRGSCVRPFVVVSARLRWACQPFGERLRMLIIADDHDDYFDDDAADAASRID